MGTEEPEEGQQGEGGRQQQQQREQKEEEEQEGQQMAGAAAGAAGAGSGQAAGGMSQADAGLADELVLEGDLGLDEGGLFAGMPLPGPLGTATAAELAGGLLLQGSRWRCGAHSGAACMLAARCTLLLA